MNRLKLNVIIFLAAGFCFASCKNENSQEAQTLDVEEVEQITPGSERGAADATEGIRFDNAGMNTVFSEYIDLKNSFIKSEPSEIKGEASNFALAISNIDASQELKNATEKINNSEDIEEQRKAFFNISEEVEKLIEGSVTSGTIYKQHCPMAFNDQGASWLSVSQEIRNPYYGDKMLKCGSVQKTYSEDGTVEAED